MDSTLTSLIIIAIPIIVIILIYYVFQQIKQFKSISNTETSRIGFLQKGLHEIKGKIAPLEEKLISPFSEIPCVYYKFEVKEHKGSGKSSRWITVIEDEKYKKFEINDGSGYAIIDLKDSNLNLKIDNSKESGFLDKASPQMTKVLRKYGKSKHGWIFEKSLKYKETYLKQGDELYVLGEVDNFEHFKPIFKQNNKPLIISDKSEDVLLKELKRKIIICFAFLIALPILEIYLIL